MAVIVRALCSVAVLFFVIAPSPAKIAEVSAEDAAHHLVKKIDPVYPTFAKTLRIQDTVVLKLVIAADGSVLRVDRVSGNPMLIESSIEAVKQWHYSPFLVDGKASEVTTAVSIPFSLGIPDADYKKEEETSRRYFADDKRCRAAISAGHFSEAQSICTEEVKLGEQLPAAREMERFEAYGLLGQAYFYDYKFPEALTYFQHQLESAKKKLHDDDAEMAYAYHHMGMGLTTNHRTEEAIPYYERAETTLRAAQNKIGSEFLKNQYAKTLKTIMSEHAILLRHVDKNADADALDNAAQAIVVRTDIKPD